MKIGNVWNMTLQSNSLSGGWTQSLADYIHGRIEKNALKMIVDGYERWRKEEFHSYDHTENSYTVRLVDNIGKAMREQGMTEFEACYQNEELTRDISEGNAPPNTSPQSDMVLRIRSEHVKRTVVISVECKRLEYGAEWPKKYVLKGMSRFIIGKYGARSKTGVMVGYVVATTFEEVSNRINAQIKLHFGDEQDQMLIPFDPIQEYTAKYESNHLRDSSFGGPIRLMHLFFYMDGIEYRN